MLPTCSLVDCRQDVAALAPPDAVASVARGRASAANAYATLREAGMADAEARELAGLQCGRSGRERRRV